jgi:hypothetical protein
MASSHDWVPNVGQIRSRRTRLWVKSSNNVPLPVEEQSFKVRPPHWLQRYGETHLVCSFCKKPTAHDQNCDVWKAKKKKLKPLNIVERTTIRNAVRGVSSLLNFYEKKHSTEIPEVNEADDSDDDYEEDDDQNLQHISPTATTTTTTAATTTTTTTMITNEVESSSVLQSSCARLGAHDSTSMDAATSIPVSNAPENSSLTPLVEQASTESVQSAIGGTPQQSPTQISIDEENYTVDPEFEQDDPGGAQPSNNTLKLLHKYANSVFSYYFEAQLPAIYNGKPVNKTEDWQKKACIDSCCRNFPDPQCIRDIDALKDFDMSAESFVLADSEIRVVDWEAFYWRYLRKEGFRCTCGKKLHRDGYSVNCRICRGVDLKLTVFKFVLYRCADCDKPRPGRKDRMFSSISFHIIKQLTPYPMSSFPYVSTNGSIIPVSIIDSLFAFRERKLAFNAFEEASYETIETALYDKEIQRHHLAEFRSKEVEGRLVTKKITGLSCMDFLHFFVTSAILIPAYLDRYEQQNALIQTSFINAAEGIEQLSMDMNHALGSKGSKDGHFGNNHAQNPWGEVVFGQAQCSKSIKESESALREVAKRAPLLKGVHTDEPEAVKSLFEKIWARDNIKFVKDPFHLANLLAKAVNAKSEFARLLFSRFSGLMWRYDIDDIKRKRQQMLAVGVQSTEVEKQLSCARFLSSCASKGEVRRYLNSPEPFITGIDKLYSELSMTDVFNNKIHATLQNIKAVIRDFFQEAEDTELYINSGTLELPKYHPIRGTNNNENLHHQINQLDLHLCSTDLQDALYCRLLFRYSHNKRWRIRGLDLPKGMVDPIRMNTFCTLQARCRQAGIVVLDKEYLTGHKFLEKASVSYSGFKYDNPNSSIGIATRLVDPELTEDWFEFPAGIQQSSFLKNVNRNLKVLEPPRGQDFQHKDEYTLLRMILSTDECVRRKHKIINNDGSLNLSAYDTLRKGKLNKIFNVEKLTIAWNVYVCSAHAASDASITIRGETVSTENISPKEKVQMRKGLMEYSRRFVHKASNIPRAPAAHVVASTAPPPILGATEIAISSDPASELIAPPASIPRAHMADITQEVVVRVSGKKRTFEAKQVAEEPPSKSKRTNEPCIECHLKKHISDCPYILWYNDPQKTENPARPRVNGKQLTRQEASRQYWNSNREELLKRYKANSNDAPS